MRFGLFCLKKKRLHEIQTEFERFAAGAGKAVSRTSSPMPFKPHSRVVSAVQAKGIVHKSNDTCDDKNKKLCMSHTIKFVTKIKYRARIKIAARQR
jgi:hypothetical protein